MSELIAAFRARLIGSGVHRVLIYSPDDIVDIGGYETAQPGRTMYPLVIPIDATLPDALQLLACNLRANDAKDVGAERVAQLARGFVDDVFASPDLRCDDLDLAHLRELLVLVYEAGARGDAKMRPAKGPDKVGAEGVT